jgi:hypothetical protein
MVPWAATLCQYMLLVYEEEVGSAVQAERELPALVELHRSLREAALLRSVRSLPSGASARSCGAVSLGEHALGRLDRGIPELREASGRPRVL